MENLEHPIILRPFSSKDEIKYYNISRSDAVKEYFPYYSENFEDACEIVRIFSKGDFKNNFYFAIEEKNKGNLIGAVIAERITETDFNIGYFVGQEYHNRGYVTLAIKLLIEYLKNIGAKSVCFSVSRENLASISVANKINASKVSDGDKYEMWKKILWVSMNNYCNI